MDASGLVAIPINTPEVLTYTYERNLIWIADALLAIAIPLFFSLYETCSALALMVRTDRRQPLVWDRCAVRVQLSDIERAYHASS
jgi:hypothetical protein